MTTCRECRDRLSPYLEGELESRESSPLEEHLAGCAACRAELELLRLTVDGLRGLPDLPAPAGILEGVKEGIVPLPWHRRLVRALAGPGGKRLPLGAFATLLVAFGIFLLTERFPEFSQPPRVISPTAVPISEPVAEPVRSPEPSLPPAEKAREEADRDDAFPAVSESEMPAAIPMEEKVVAHAAGDEARGEDRKDLETAEAPADAIVTLPKRDAPPVVLRGKGETNAGPSYRTAQGLAKAPSEIKVTGQAGTNLPPEAGERLAFTAGSKKEISRDLGAMDSEKRRKAKGPTPLRPEGEAAAVASFADSRKSLGDATMAETRAGRTEDTEIFTIVSLTEDEVGELRHSLKEAGGRLLEMKTIDAYSSQQMAMPYQNRIPVSQMISRGWQIRATVPRDNIGTFVDSLSERQALQVLHRAQAPADWEAGPGSQKIEINLIR